MRWIIDYLSFCIFSFFHFLLRLTLLMNWTLKTFFVSPVVSPFLILFVSVIIPFVLKSFGHYRSHNALQSFETRNLKHLSIYLSIYLSISITWDCRIHSLHLCRRPFHSEWPRYDIKESDGEVPVLELWGRWSILSLLLLPVPLWPE